MMGRVESSSTGGPVGQNNQSIDQEMLLKYFMEAELTEVRSGFRRKELMV